MELENLEAKARVATDLFEKGVARVKITGTDIEVDWREYAEATSGDRSAVSQTVKVNVSTTALAVSSISERIHEIAGELDKSGVDSKKVLEAKQRLETLEKELKKTNPRWKVAKQVLRWSLDFSKELSLRLAVIVAERFMTAK